MMDVQFRRQFLKEKAVIARRHLPAFLQGQVDVFTLPVESLGDVALAYAEAAESEGKLVVCKTAAEVEAVTAAGAVALVLCGNFLTLDPPGNVHLLRPLGIRMLSYALNTRNPLGDGCGERRASGLSHLGVELLQPLLRAGVMIDVSHLSDAGLEDVLMSVNGPIIASHSNCRALADNPRNLTDDQIKAIAAGGGLVALSTYPTLIRSSGVTLEHYLDQLEHAVGLVGPEHVALGADFVAYAREIIMPKVHASDKTGALYGRGYEAPEGLTGIGDMGAIVAGMARRGWPEASVRKVARENFIGLMRRLEVAQ